MGHNGGSRPSSDIPTDVSIYCGFERVESTAPNESRLAGFSLVTAANAAKRKRRIFLWGWGDWVVGKHCLGSHLAVTKTYRSDLIQHEQQRDVNPEPRSQAAVVAWKLVVTRPMHVRPHVADGFPDVTVFVCPCQQRGTGETGIDSIFEQREREKKKGGCHR